MRRGCEGCRNKEQERGSGESPCMNEFVRDGQKPRRPTKVIGFALTSDSETASTPSSFALPCFARK